MKINDKLKEIIPPNDYKHRYEFSNHHMIDELTAEERNEMEDLLIKKLLGDPADTLIVQTLSYMKSKKSISTLKYSLEYSKNNLEKIIIAASIFKVNMEKDMTDVAKENFKKLKNKIDLISAFDYLADFKDVQINAMIKKYANSSDFLISYNAKKALGSVSK